MSPNNRLSFSGTLHRVRMMLPLWMYLAAQQPIRQAELLDHLLASIASDLLPDRPDRVEPRRKKRRPKQYSLLNKPRCWYRVHGDKEAR